MFICAMKICVLKKAVELTKFQRAKVASIFLLTLFLHVSLDTLPCANPLL